MIDHVTYDPTHDNLDERGLNSFKNAKMYNNSKLKNSSQTWDQSTEVQKAQLLPKLSYKLAADTPNQGQKYQSANRTRAGTKKIEPTRSKKAS